MDVPEAWIKNKTARAEFQFLKRNNVVDKKASRTPPKGIPDHLLTKKDLAEDEKIDSDSPASVVKKRIKAAGRSRRRLSTKKNPVSIGSKQTDKWLSYTHSVIYIT